MAFIVLNQAKAVVASGSLSYGGTPQQLAKLFDELDALPKFQSIPCVNDPGHQAPVIVSVPHPLPPRQHEVNVVSSARSSRPNQVSVESTSSPDGDHAGSDHCGKSCRRFARAGKGKYGARCWFAHDSAFDIY